MAVNENKTAIRRPNFFIVGAPRCGTTAMYEYLRQHPDIFMANEKEPHFFGTDLIQTPKFPYYKRDMEWYLSTFVEAGPKIMLGEASILYLKSKLAASEIKEFSPDAKIIAMLRNPVDMLSSMHSHVLYDGSEDIEDFELALEAQTDRELGRRIPKGCGIVDYLLYKDIANYSDQLERYFAEFDRDKVHVIIFDDFRSETPNVYAETLQFLGVDSRFQPEFSTINENRRIRNGLLRALWTNRPNFVQQMLLDRVSPSRPRRLIIGALQRMYRRPAPRTPMDPDFRRRLQEEFTPEVDRLGNLLGRDLTHWCQE